MQGVIICTQQAKGRAQLFACKAKGFGERINVTNK